MGWRFARKGRRAIDQTELNTIRLNFLPFKAWDGRTALDRLRVCLGGCIIGWVGGWRLLLATMSFLILAFGGMVQCRQRHRNRYQNGIE